MKETNKTLDEKIISIIAGLCVGGIIYGISKPKIDKYLWNRKIDKIQEERDNRQKERQKQVYNTLMGYVKGEKVFYPKSGSGYLDYIGEDLNNIPELRKFKNFMGYHRKRDLVPFYGEFNRDKINKDYNEYRGLFVGKKAISPNWDRKKLKIAIKNLNKKR